MPTYDYRCDACGHEFEKFQSMTAKHLRKCPECGKNKLKRLIGTGAGVIFKGSGFWQTDYRSDGYKQAEKAEKDAAKPADSGSKDSGGKTDSGSSAGDSGSKDTAKSESSSKDSASQSSDSGGKSGGDSSGSDGKSSKKNKD